VTVTRPDELLAAPDDTAPGEGGRGPRIPGWAKVVAVVIVVGAIAVANNAAKDRPEKTTDAVSVKTTLQSNASPQEVQLILSVHNNGQALWLSRPFLTASGFTLEPREPFPVVLAAGATAVYVMGMQAPCVEGQLKEPVPDNARMVIPALPRSGDQRSISVAFATTSLSALGTQACGFFSGEESVFPNWSEVRLEKYAVTFTLSVNNRAHQKLLLNSIAGPGLSVSARGGFPKEVAAMSVVVVPIRVTIPACAGLPEELDQLHRFQGDAPLSLVMSFESGQELTLPVGLEPDQPLLVAIRDLARARCPTG
jgi:hypothetical protein